MNILWSLEYIKAVNDLCNDALLQSTVLSLLPINIAREQTVDKAFIKG